MLQLNGTYDNGKIILDKIIPTIKPLKIIVTFQEEPVIDKSFFKNF